MRNRSAPGNVAAFENEYASRFSASEMFLVNTTSSRLGALRKAATASRAPSIGCGCFRTERVHGAGHVRVVVRVEIGLGVDDHLGLLGAVGAVEVDEGDPVHLAAQDGNSLRTASTSMGTLHSAAHAVAVSFTPKRA